MSMYFQDLPESTVRAMVDDETQELMDELHRALKQLELAALLQIGDGTMDRVVQHINLILDALEEAGVHACIGVPSFLSHILAPVLERNRPYGRPSMVYTHATPESVQ